MSCVCDVHACGVHMYHVMCTKISNNDGGESTHVPHVHVARDKEVAHAHILPLLLPLPQKSKKIFSRRMVQHLLPCPYEPGKWSNTLPRPFIGHCHHCGWMIHLAIAQHCFKLHSLLGRKRREEMKEQDG